MAETLNQEVLPFVSFSSPNVTIDRTFRVVYIMPEITRLRRSDGRQKKLFRNPVFRAEEFQKRMQEQSLSRADLARELGVSRARVTQVLNLLKLPEDVLVKAKVAECVLTIGVS